MKINYLSHRGPTRPWSAISAVIASLLLILPSCKEEDPSYEKETLKLTAENAALETRLEEANKQMEALRMDVQRANSERDAMQAKISEASGTIDQEKIRTGFAEAVANLGQQIEQKHSDYSVDSVTFQKMKMPTDYPFSSGVMTTLVSKSSGEKRTLYWEAQGNTKGEWRFAQKSKPTTTVAQNPPPATPTSSDKPATPATPATTPATPKPPKPARPDGKSHIIDWGKLR